MSLGWGCKPCDRGHVAPSSSSHISLFSSTYYIGLDVALIGSSSSRAAWLPAVQRRHRYGLSANPPLVSPSLGSDAAVGISGGAKLC